LNHYRRTCADWIQASIDSLAAAIKEFEGGVVIVSHDFRGSQSSLHPVIY
jgi:hypothetical protein